MQNTAAALAENIKTAYQQDDQPPLFCALNTVQSEISLALSGLTPEDYCSTAHGSSIGAHIRHLLEFIQALVHGTQNGVIDYEARKRNPLYEQSPIAALQELENTISTLKNILSSTDHSLSYTLRETPSINSCKMNFTTSLGREALFVIEHATHHIALVRMLLEQQGKKPSGDIGVSVATYMYRQKTETSSAAS